MRYAVLEKKHLPKSEFLLVLEIPAVEIKTREEEVLSRMQEGAELPGFRKGKVPKEMLRSRAGDLRIFEDAALEVLEQALAEVIEAEKLSVISLPRVEPQRIAPGNEALFRVTLTLFPALSLPDYKRIAAEENREPTEAPSVSEKEVDEVLKNIQKQQETERGSAFALTDETVQELSPFKTLTEFRERVKTDLLAHKGERAKEKRRGKLLARLRKASTGEIPELLIETELDKIEAELKAELKRAGATLEEYFREIKKDRTALRREWREAAEEEARLEVILFMIAKEEGITAPVAEVEREVARIKEAYREADVESARRFVEMLLIKRRVIEFLEAQR